MEVQIPDSTMLKEDRFKSKRGYQEKQINEVEAYLVLKIIFFPTATISGTADTHEIESFFFPHNEGTMFRSTLPI